MQITNSYTNYLQGFTDKKIEYSESSNSSDNKAIGKENARGGVPCGPWTLLCPSEPPMFR